MKKLKNNNYYFQNCYQKYIWKIQKMLLSLYFKKGFKMNTQKTISYNTKFMADAVGYDNYNIIQSVIPTGEHRKTCTLETLHNWIKSNHNMIVDVQYDDSQLWGYVLWDCRSDELMHIDNDSMFETDEIAFEKGLQRALYEIKCNKK